MSRISRIDISFSTWVQYHFMSSGQTKFWRRVTSLADYVWFWFLTILVFCMNSRTRNAGIRALITLGTCFFITNILLKNICGRERPFNSHCGVIPLIDEPGDMSFPSGHTSASFSCAFVYLILLPLKIALPLVILAALIGWSRIYLGVHYLSDVIGGIFIPLLVANLVCAL